MDAYFHKFLITNLKLILKGKILGKSQEDIESYFNFHAEELINQRDVVVKALVAKDLEEAVSSLSSSPFSADISKLSNCIMRQKILRHLIFTLTRCYTSKLARQSEARIIKTLLESMEEILTFTIS